MEIPQTISCKMQNMALFCAFLIVVIHCRPNYEPQTFAWWVNQFTGEGVARIAVPYFFAASGYVAAAKYNGYSALVLKRLRTLLVPFTIWSMLFLFFCIVARWLYAGQAAPLIVEGFNSPLLLIKMLGFWPMGMPLLTPLWYVRALLFLTLLFPILRRCVKSFGLAWLVAVFFLYSIRVVSFASPWWNGIQTFAWCGLLPVEGLVYYSFGIWLCYHMNVIYNDRKNVCVVSLIFGLGIAAMRSACFISGHYASSHALKYMMIPFLLLGVWGIVSDRRFPRWLVSSSFGIYLIHEFALRLLNPICDAGHGVHQYFLKAVIAFFASLCVTVTIHRILPKVSAVLFGGR